MVVNFAFVLLYFIAFSWRLLFYLAPVRRLEKYWMCGETDFFS